jgi:prepilin signal peptidase PulO-like enzyme (type II secretory pathway)
MNTCPHCNANPCLPLWRKLFMGPTSTARCQTCGYRVGLDVQRACLAMLPTVVAVIAAAFAAVAGALQALVLIAGLLLLGPILTFMLNDSWVPLRPDELTTASMVEAGRARVATQKRAATKQHRS